MAKQAILNKLPLLLGVVVIGQGVSQEQSSAPVFLHMQIRFELADALLAIDTSTAVRQAHDYLVDVLRLSMKDVLGARYLIPGLKLRLGRDQECFDFCSHWIVEGDKVRWNGPIRQLVRSANVFYSIQDLQKFIRAGYPRVIEQMDIFEQIPSLCLDKVDIYNVLFTLIKIRLIQDLHKLRNSSLLFTGLPILRTRLSQEISDMIRGHLMLNVSKYRHRELFDGGDPQPLIQRLEKQVLELIESKKRDHPAGWDLLVQLGRHPTALAMPHDKHMQAAMSWSFDAWMESKFNVSNQFLSQADSPLKHQELSMSLQACSIANPKTQILDVRRAKT